ncbi:hypothetical protein BMS3Bbin14_00452 [bacterium BMS3Bbin14]|nr:hypothetical protein BMS3Bbin14_00452 [bacterium BMS3Bbin14]
MQGGNDVLSWCDVTAFPIMITMFSSYLKILLNTTIRTLVSNQ